MTTAANLATSLSTLEGALTGAGIAVAPSPGQMSSPCAIVGGPPGTWIAYGSARRLPADKLAVTWRILLVAGLIDTNSARDELVGLAGAAFDAVSALAGYRVGELGRFGQHELGGALYLAADMTAETAVTIEPEEA